MASKPRVRKGFTLVEMLVVITIIAMLAAILLPAVNSAREAARRVQCNTNLTQVVKATMQWEASFGRLPGYQEYVARPYTAVGASTADSRGRKVSWVVVLLPQLEMLPLYDDWTRIENPFPNPPMPFVVGGSPNQLGPQIASLMCPSDISLDSTVPALSYVANAGPSIEWLTSLNVTTLNRADGLFFDQFNDNNSSNEPVYDNARVNVRSDGVRDGKDYTLIYSENVHEAKMNPATGEHYNLWYAVEPTDNTAPPANARRWTTFVYQHDPTRPSIDIQGNPIQAARINQSARVDSNGRYAIVTSGNDVAARPASFHPGGVNVAFLGGSTRFLRENIDYLVYQQLMTADDRKSTMTAQSMPGWTSSMPALSSGQFE